jgi:transketolase
MQKISEKNKEELTALAKNVRKDIMDMVTPTKSSHVGSAFSIVDILVTLYKLAMNHDPLNPKMQNRDRFLLSKGHACTALYGILAELGYFSKDFLREYSKDGSILMSHTNSEVPGVEISTGSLGHALPVGVGMALSAKTKGEKWTVYVLLSDGELNEGSNWEALMMASQLKMDNLFVIVDRNQIQGLGKTEDVINMHPLAMKFEAFNCDVLEVDGHNFDDLYETVQKLSEIKSGKPKVIIANTTKGKGISYMENTIAWHYRSPNPEEYTKGIKELEK